MSESVRVLLLARSATAAQPLREMERWRDAVAALPGVSIASFAFSEEGLPSLRDGLRVLVEANDQPIVIVPMVLPSEPSFENWLRRTIQRWQAADTRPWPEIRVAGFPGAQAQMQDVLASCLATNAPVEPGKPAGDGSIVPAQKRRVLVCMGSPCNASGAAPIWGHLRNEQKRLSLRTAGEGMMSAKTSCLGPCSLAPVLQVWPEGTLYGGIDEAGVDRIVRDHLLGGRIVEVLAYHPTGVKQRLRD
jgi:(2Fe-2S) ferredoxin